MWVQINGVFKLYWSHVRHRPVLLNWTACTCLTTDMYSIRWRTQTFSSDPTFHSYIHTLFKQVITDSTFFCFSQAPGLHRHYFFSNILTVASLSLICHAWRTPSVTKPLQESHSPNLKHTNRSSTYCKVFNYPIPASGKGHKLGQHRDLHSAVLPSSRQYPMYLTQHSAYLPLWQENSKPRAGFYEATLVSFLRKSQYLSARSHCTGLIRV